MAKKEAAAKWNILISRVQTMCYEGMVEDDMRFGGVWAIPKDDEKPIDKRIKSKRYIKS